MRISRRTATALALAAFALLAAIRLLTLAPDPWSWDEVLFTLAVKHGIDLRLHHPHPPGYPLFVELARLIAALGVEAYRSLAIVGAVGSLLAVAALVALLRVAGVSREGALFGGLLYAFVPSVWLFGVRGFSDAPAAAGFFAAAAALLAALETEPGAALVCAPVLVALTAGIRPQGAVPLVPLLGLCLFRAAARGGRARRLAALGLAAAALATLAIWVPAIRSSGGWRSFVAQVAIQADDTRRHATISARDLASWGFWRRWTADPFGPAWLFALVASAALLGAALRPRRARTLALVFVPWVVLVVPFSAPFAAPRYGAVPLALPCALAALALDAARERSARASAAPATALLAACAFVGAPTVARVAETPSPTVAAMRALARPPFDRGTVVHDPQLRVHLELFHPGRARGEIPPDRPVSAAPGDVVVTVDRSWPGAPAWSAGLGGETLRRIGHGSLMRVEMGIARSAMPVGLRGGAAPAVRYDETLPVSVDSPRDGERVSGELVVRGWCQERGGGAIEPAEARLDGIAARRLRLERMPRPDVARAVPDIGDASRAGYELVLDASALAPGPHVLVMSFRARDGRQRILGARRFVWEGR